MQIEYRRPPDCFKSALSCVSVYIGKPKSLGEVQCNFLS